MFLSSEPEILEHKAPPKNPAPKSPNLEETPQPRTLKLLKPRTLATRQAYKTPRTSFQDLQSPSQGPLKKNTQPEAMPRTLSPARPRKTKKKKRPGARSSAISDVGVLGEDRVLPDRPSASSCFAFCSGVGGSSGGLGIMRLSDFGLLVVGN